MRFLGSYDDPDLARAALMILPKTIGKTRSRTSAPLAQVGTFPSTGQICAALGVYRDGMTRGAACQAIAQRDDHAPVPCAQDREVAVPV